MLLHRVVAHHHHLRLGGLGPHGYDVDLHTLLFPYPPSFGQGPQGIVQAAVHDQDGHPLRAFPRAATVPEGRPPQVPDETGEVVCGVRVQGLHQVVLALVLVEAEALGGLAGKAGVRGHQTQLHLVAVDLHVAGDGLHEVHGLLRVLLARVGAVHHEHQIRLLPRSAGCVVRGVG